MAPAKLFFSKCSCCGTEWYKTQTDHNDDNGGVEADAKAPAANAMNRRRECRHRRHRHPSHLDLLQIPRCECVIQLAVPPLPSVVVAPALTRLTIVIGGRWEDGKLPHDNDDNNKRQRCALED